MERVYVEVGKEVERVQNSEGVEAIKSEMELRGLRAKLIKMIKSVYLQEIGSVVTTDEVKKAYMMNETSVKSSTKTISVSTKASAPPTTSPYVLPL